MPHKHTRRGDLDKSTIDLPPSQVAKPLPTSKGANANGVFTAHLSNARRPNKKRKRRDDDDDTPRAFARLMAFTQGKKLPKGLDDGVQSTKKEKKRQLAAEKAAEAGEAAKVEAVPGAPEVPTIRPGERMSDFAARVDAALPVSGLISKTTRNGKDPLGLKVGRTKKEKQMQRLYAEWRTEEGRVQEKRQEAMELREEEEMDEDGQVKWKAEIEDSPPTSRKKKKSKGSKKKKVIGEVNDGDDDPWAKIKQNRGEVKAGLHDVVQAPPTFTKLPEAKFKVRGARVEVDDVPRASGSLRRREELGEERKNIIENYRLMMASSKAKQATQ